MCFDNLQAEYNYDEDDTDIHTNQLLGQITALHTL